MKRLKNIFSRLLFIPVGAMLLLVPIAAAMLIYTLAFGNTSSGTAYFSYFLSAYTLTVLCIRAPALYKSLKAFKEKNAYINLYTSDARLRMKISLFTSVSLNTAYALLQLFSGFYYHSIWFYALSGYYSLLAVIRFFLLRNVRKDSRDVLNELYRCRFCAILLLLMNAALSVIVFYIVRQNRGFSYHYIYTIALAAYTFTALTLSVASLIRSRKYKSPLMSAVKAVNLTAAAVSLLCVETAMLSAFSETESPQFRRTITALTGAGICIFVLTAAIYMIFKSTKEINSRRRKNG